MVPFAGAILDRSAAAFGLMAAMIGIGAFLGRASRVLRRRSEEEVRRATMYGGLAGMLFAVGLVLIDTIAG
jgi:hypothetical protein